MPYVSGNTIVDQWTVLKAADDTPLTGMTSPADVTLTLLRQSGATFVAASETISWTEIGSTGRYYFSFTPAATGRYVLELNELNVNSEQRRGVRFAYDILSSGTAFLPSYANAFCSEADIERWLQQGISSSTKPSDTETAAWAEGTASRLMSLCAGLNYPVTPSTVISGSRLQDLLRDANAIETAIYYTVAQSFATTPSKTERATWLEGVLVNFTGGYDQVRKQWIPGSIASEIRANLASLASNQIVSGEVLASIDMTTPTDIGITFKMDDKF